MYAGAAAEGGWNGFKATQSSVGRHLAVRRSYNTLELPGTWDNSTCGRDAENAPMFSAFSFGGFLPSATLADGSPNPTYSSDVASILAVLTGLKNRAYDKTVKSWVQSIPAGQFVDVAIGHEMDVKISQGVYTAQQIVDAYTGFASTLSDLRAAKVQNIERVRLATCITAFAIKTTTTGSAWRTSDLQPLSTILDLAEVIAVDAYGKGTISVSGLLPKFFDFCDANWAGKATAVWEFSTTPDQPGTRPQWIKDFFRTCFERNCQYLCGYNSSVGGSSPLVGDPESAAAFADSMDRYCVPYVLGTAPGGGGDPIVNPPRPPGKQSGLAGSYIWMNWA